MVVELWVVLKGSIASTVTGIVQNTSSMRGQDRVSIPNNGDIGGGRQTVSLSQVGDFYTAQADLSVTKTDSPDPVVAGQNLTYTITATNNSTDTYANSVVITDTLDSNVTFVGASDGGTAASGVVTWPTTALAPLQTVTRTVTVTVKASAPTENYTGTTAHEPGWATAPAAGTFDIDNWVKIAAITSDPTPGNNNWYEPTNVLPGTVDLSITKTDDVDPVGAGGTITYSLLVKNLSGITSATSVVVTDTIIPRRPSSRTPSRSAVTRTPTTSRRAS